MGGGNFSLPHIKAARARPPPQLSGPLESPAPKKPDRVGPSGKQRGQAAGLLFRPRNAPRPCPESPDTPGGAPPWRWKRNFRRMELKKPLTKDGFFHPPRCFRRKAFINKSKTKAVCVRPRRKQVENRAEIVLGFPGDQANPFPGTPAFDTHRAGPFDTFRPGQGHAFWKRKTARPVRRPNYA